MTGAIHLTFSDPYQYERSICPAKVSDLVVSESGAFEATLTNMNVGRVWLQSGSERLARTARIAIGASQRSLIFLADSHAKPIIQSGKEFGAGEIVSFGQHTSHFQRTFGPIRWAAMSLLPDNLQSTVMAAAGRDLGAPSISLRIKPSVASLSRLRQLHFSAERMAISGKGMLDHPEARRSLEQTLIAAMVACITDDTEHAYSVGSHRHEKIMLRFGEWLDANKDRAVYLDEVCAALDTSGPTFRRCCEQHLGMSPMKYLGLRRMNLARRELQRRDSHTSVTATAMNFGFWHLGRFAYDYRSLFGESPSATLARRSLH